MAKARVDIIDGLRAHDRSDDALRFVTPAVVWYREQFRRDLLAHPGRPADAVAELRHAITKGLAPAEVFHANFGLDPLRGYRAYDALVRPRK